MPLKYYNASEEIRTKNPTKAYYEDYAAMLDFSFDNAPNVVYDEIEVEKTYGENDFVTLHRVRVDTILNYNTGIILGDDYKLFLFDSSFDVEPFYGMKFRWKNSYWLVINTNAYASVPNTVEVRRCNNVLRFFDSDGNKIYEPCIMDYTLRFANNEDTMTITVGNGEQKVWCQRNKRTTQIKANDRFLFGSPEQRVAFRLYAGGTKNYLNTETLNDESPTLIEFYLDHYEINPVFDDLENGFADAYFKQTSIKIINEQSSLNIGDKMNLEAIVYKGQEVVDDIFVDWSLSDNEIGSIENNVFTANKVGKVDIIASIFDGVISTSSALDIVESPITDTYDLICENDKLYVLQGEEDTFVVNLYKNGEKMDSVVTFVNTTKDVPEKYYKIEVLDKNSFKVYNYNMFMNHPLEIMCSSEGYTLNLQIRLRGLY